jgi:deoxyribonuclease V
LKRLAFRHIINMRITIVGQMNHERQLHAWDVSPEEAARIQSDLRARLVLTWDGRLIQAVGGVDVSLPPGPSTESAGGTARCAIVVLRYPDLSPIEGVTAEVPLTFPYIPGLLAFREGPAVLAAWEKLAHKPDLLMFDGQGIAHPRGLGIASQMGLWLERPTIGVAKSRLYGRAKEPGPERGAQNDLLDERGQVIGAVLRTKSNVNPLYISPGHLIDVMNSTTFVLACDGGYRLPEPTRWAHLVAGGEKLPVEREHQARLF